MVADIIFYTNRVSPLGNRAWYALELSGLPYEFREVDLLNKSEEFLRVSSTGKLPAISVNGENFVESAVIVELIANLAPNTIRSDDPIGNAKSLLWADRYLIHLRNVYQNALTGRGGSDEDKEGDFFESLDKALPYLPIKRGKFRPVVGDVIVAPYIARVQLLIDRGIFATSINEKLSSEKKYAAYVEYVEAIIGSKEFKVTFDKDTVFPYLTKGIKRSIDSGEDGQTRMGKIIYTLR